MALLIIAFICSNSVALGTLPAMLCGRFSAELSDSRLLLDYSCKVCVVATSDPLSVVKPACKVVSSVIGRKPYLMLTAICADSNVFLSRILLAAPEGVERLVSLV